MNSQFMHPGGRAGGAHGVCFSRLVLIISLASVWLAACSSRTRSKARPPKQSITRLATAAPATKVAAATELVSPNARLGLHTGEQDALGRPIILSCLTCHKGLVEGDAARFRKTKGAFHRHIELVHGTKTCRTCHRAPGFEDFNLADGTAVPFGRVMELCGQCHARRLEEYRRGAHGGMTGHWDRGKGPRQRNHCLDCHNAHQPRIASVRPAPRALD